MAKLQNSQPAIAGVCRQLPNAYLNFSNVNVLLAGRNVIVPRLATLSHPRLSTALESLSTCQVMPGAKARASSEPFVAREATLSEVASEGSRL